MNALRTALLGIGITTVATGATQAIAPRFVLTRVGATADAGSTQLFGTVGMFMIVIGGLLVRTLTRPRPDRDVLAWSAAQKAGACTAMIIGVGRGVFAPAALLVAAFDGLSAVLLLVLRGRS